MAHEDTQYEAPVVEELSVDEGPAAVQAGTTPVSQIPK